MDESATECPDPAAEVEALRARADLYLDIAGTMIIGLDDKGCVVQINAKGCEVLGYTETDILGRDWFETVIPAGEREAVRAAFRQLMAGEIEPAEYFENQVVSHAGGERIIAWHNVVMRDEEGRITGTLSSGRDVTQQRRMEAALRESDRLEAAGAMAETVSQNFGHVLEAISGYASFLTDSLIPETRPYRYAERIIAATRHASELTRRLMSVAKASAPGAIDVAPVNLAHVIRRTLDLLDHVFAPRNVKVVVKNEEAIPAVMAEADQLIDVLMSILTNSAEAMPSGGTITIDHVRRRIVKPRSNPNAKGGEYVGLRVRDTGVGMSRSVRRQVFEPFFTTKGSTTAFGLGLPVAQNMTQAMGGWIDVRSREGIGSLFRLFLLRAAPQEGESEEKVKVPQSVLVIDDSAADLLLMTNALQAEGHDVHTATTGDDGVSVLQEQGSRITVVVVDFLLSTANGNPLLEEILRSDPQAKIVVTSGFSRDYVRECVSLGSWSFLQKPFSALALVEAVHEVVRRYAAD